MIWIVILVLVMVAMACSIIYLTNRIGKIGFVRKISRENKKINKLFSIVLLAMIIAVATVFLNFVNAIIIILHLVVFWILCDLIGLIITKIRKKKFNTYYSWIFAVLITAIYLFIGWNQVNNVVETDYKLTTEKDIKPIRIVQFADSHVGTTFSGKGLEKYVSEINSKNPDVVVITGDFVDDDTSIDDMRDACKALSGLQTKFGVYYCFGNHDMGYYGKKNRGYDGNDLIKELEKNNVVVLQDDTVLIDDRFYIVGRQDKSVDTDYYKRDDIREITKKLDKDKYIIVLDHQPNDYDNEAESDADLVLSGHTHGGQLIPITFIGELLKINDSTYGYKKMKNTDFIVTSGISDWSIKFKTGCFSEYVVIDIK